MKTTLIKHLVLAVAFIVLGSLATASFASDKAKGPALRKALGQVELFDGLTAKEKAAIGSAATLRHCKAGDRIIENGKTLDKMFVLLDSQADVKIKGNTVATLPGKSLIGEIEYLDKRPASADVTISKESDMIEIDNGAFDKLLKKYPRMGYVLMSRIAKIEAERLRANNER